MHQSRRERGVVQSYTDTEFPLSLLPTLSSPSPFNSQAAFSAEETKNSTAVGNLPPRDAEQQPMNQKKSQCPSPFSTTILFPVLILSITTRIILRTAFELSHTIHLDHRTGKMTVQRGSSEARQLHFPVGSVLSTWHWSITVKVTAGWYPDLVCTEWVSRFKAGRARFSFLYPRKFMFLKCLRLFTVPLWGHALTSC